MLRAVPVVAAALAALAAAASAGALPPPSPRLAQPIELLPAAVPPATQPPVLGQPIQGAPPVFPAKLPLSVELSSRRAGARPVSLTLRFRTLLQCGRPRGAIVVTLPAAATVPRSVAASAVRVGGTPAAHVSVRGSTLTVRQAAPGVTCMSITEGPETVTIGRAAGIGNPAAPGRYAVGVANGTSRLRTTISIAR